MLKVWENVGKPEDHLGIILESPYLMHHLDESLYNHLGITLESLWNHLT